MSNKQMYSAFVQINREEYLIAMAKANPSASVLFNFFLLKMDKLRDKDASSFPEWKEESIAFMNKVDVFLSYLSDKYDI